MIVPPPQSGPPLPPARVVKGGEEPNPDGRVSRGERAMLLAVVLMLVLLFTVAVILPHMPFVAEM